MLSNLQIVEIAADAGYYSLFIDPELSTLSLKDASHVYLASSDLGVTPFVRVPYQREDGIVQRVLDGGAMGVVFLHIHSRGTIKYKYAITCPLH